MGNRQRFANSPNAGRTQLYEHVTPGTPEVLAFLAVVKHRFPGLEVEKLFVPVH